MNKYLEIYNGKTKYTITPEIVKVLNLTDLLGISPISDSVYAYEKTVEKEVFINTLDREKLLEAGILLVDYHKRGVTYSTLKMLNDLLLEHKVKYEIYYNNGSVTDQTGRSLLQIIDEGYRGTRLDVMVKPYTIYLLMYGYSVAIAYVENRNITLMNVIYNTRITTMIMKLRQPKKAPHIRRGIAFVEPDVYTVRMLPKEK
jgi:hypothetical protein